jgi:hypothetical protein
MECWIAVVRVRARVAVQRLEQYVGGAVAKGVLQLVDRQAVAVAAETLQFDRWARHIAA